MLFHRSKSIKKPGSSKFGDPGPEKAATGCQSPSSPGGDPPILHIIIMPHIIMVFVLAAVMKDLLLFLAITPKTKASPRIREEACFRTISLDHLPGFPAGVGTVSLSRRLPRFRRACPSTALDESIPYLVYGGYCIYPRRKYFARPYQYSGRLSTG